MVDKQENLAEGVIVGCSKAFDWLLPWWFVNYRLHNTYPITFFNFGDMSPKAIEWCKQRGNVILFDQDISFIAGKEDVDLFLATLWEGIRPDIWTLRKAWFKKPLVFGQSPYQKTVWIDLDCKIVGSIQPLFTEHLKRFDVAIAPELEIDHGINRQRKILLPGEVMYNTGVVAFKKGAPLMQQWEERARTENQLHLGDQQLLSRMIFEENAAIEKLPSIYNWPASRGLNPEAVIVHYWGGYQSILKNHIAFLKNKWIMDLSAYT